MTYTQETRNKIEAYLKEKQAVLKTELLYLGELKRQVHPTTLALVLIDLEDEHKIKIKETRISKSRIFYLVQWKGE